MWITSLPAVDQMPMKPHPPNHNLREESSRTRQFPLRLFLYVASFSGFNFLAFEGPSGPWQPEPGQIDASRHGSMRPHAARRAVSSGLDKKHGTWNFC